MNVTVLRKTKEASPARLTVCFLLKPTNMTLRLSPFLAYEDLRMQGWVENGVFTRRLTMEQSRCLYLAEGILVSLIFETNDVFPPWMLN